VTYARANSWQAAKRPVAATPGASLPLDASLLSIVANLEGLDLDGLRRQWRAHLGGEAPAHLSRRLLMKLAYRLESDAFGDLDKSIRRILRAMAAHTKVGVGYNIQVAVDAKHKLIVEQAVTNQVAPIMPVNGHRGKRLTDVEAGCDTAELFEF
jgi:hypothetical protein